MIAADTAGASANEAPQESRAQRFTMPPGNRSRTTVATTSAPNASQLTVSS